MNDKVCSYGNIVWQFQLIFYELILVVYVMNYFK